jgi:hypothetical protein
MKDFNLEQWLEREADRWYCKDQATIAKSSCLKGFNKAKELYDQQLAELKQEYFEAGRLKVGHQSQMDWAYKTASDYESKKAEIHPCADCGKLRSIDQGASVFTVCDECWNKKHESKKDGQDG